MRRASLSLGLLVFLTGTCLATSPGPEPQPPGFTPCWANISLRALPYCNPNLSSDVRAADLISRLTLDEKVHQMGSWGSLSSRGDAIPRLGVEEYEYHSEALHGVRTACEDIPWARTTLFPQVGVQSTPAAKHRP